MDDLQNRILEIYKEFKKICDKHDLKYFAIGGTCIGAVRHRGFIPWDDDIDIAMPAADYKKFINIAQEELKSPLALYTYLDNPHWSWNFVKVQDVSTTFVEEDGIDQIDRYMGVFIDVMPIYGMPRGRVKQQIFSCLNDYLQYMNRKNRLGFSGGKKVIGLFTKLFKDIVYGKNLSNMFFIDKIDKYFEKIKYDNSDKIIFGWRDRIMNSKLKFSYKTVFDYEDFSSSIEVPFEDTTIKIPIGYDSYLKKEFGNYMELPPENEKVRHVTAIVDLNKSYKDYLV